MTSRDLEKRKSDLGEGMWMTISLLSSLKGQVQRRDNLTGLREAEKEDHKKWMERRFLFPEGRNVKRRGTREDDEGERRDIKEFLLFFLRWE